MKRIYLICVQLFSLIYVKAQDPHFSQPGSNPVYLNPALAGANRWPRIVSNSRSQWPGIGGVVYQTNMLSYDRYSYKLGGGWATQIMYDNAGMNTITTTGWSFAYSYSYAVTRQLYIKSGLQAAVIQKCLNNKFTFGDQIDNRNGFIYQTQENFMNGQAKSYKIFPDFAFGTVVHTKNFQAGMAVHHLTRPNEGFISEARLPLKYTVHLSYNKRISANPAQNFSGSIVYKQQQDFRELLVGFQAQKSGLYAGLWCRNQDAVIVCLGIINKKYTIGYSYDITMSKLQNSSTFGTHELSLIYYFKCPKRSVKIKPIPCTF